MTRTAFLSTGDADTLAAAADVLYKLSAVVADGLHHADPYDAYGRGKLGGKLDAAREAITNALACAIAYQDDPEARRALDTFHATLTS